MDDSLSQSLADALLAMEKHCLSKDSLNFPSLGDKITLEMASTDLKEEFLLDINRTSIVVKHATLQNRAQKTVILARLCINKGHRNPDGVDVPAPHLHLYKQGFADKYAHALPAGVFTNTEDIYVTYQEFMKFCNVTVMPNMTWQTDLIKEGGL